MNRGPRLAHAEDVDWGDARAVDRSSAEALREDNARLRRMIIDMCREVGVRENESPPAGARRVMARLRDADARYERLKIEHTRTLEVLRHHKAEAKALRIELAERKP